MEQQTPIKTIEILSGIPCSGKSIYSMQQTQYLGVERVSRDDIREYVEYFNQPYKFSKNNEDKVSKIFHNYVHNHLVTRFIDTIILDNCHTQEKYIYVILMVH